MGQFGIGHQVCCHVSLREHAELKVPQHDDDLDSPLFHLCRQLRREDEERHGISIDYLLFHLYAHLRRNGKLCSVGVRARDPASACSCKGYCYWDFIELALGMLTYTISQLSLLMSWQNFFVVIITPTLISSVRILSGLRLLYSLG